MFANRSVAAAIAWLAIPLLLCSAGIGLAQTVDSTLWVTDGTVYSVASDGGVIYIGGGFRYVGPPTGAGVTIDTSTAAVLRPYAGVDGRVIAVAADGSGGWYLGGGFTSVRGQPRRGLAHLDASGNLTSWNPNPNNAVLSLAVSGGTVYVGGAFTTVGGQARSYIAALDATSGAATSWDPGADESVWCVAESGGTVYVSGYFTSIGGQPRNHIAALDAATGSVTAWDPNADDLVRVLLVNGNTVYVGGLFTSIGGQARRYAAAIDASTGTATGWNPSPEDGDVYAIAVDGGVVYAGGTFSVIGGQPRNHIAALDAAGGAVATWNPNASSAVRALALSGGTLYAGGDFTTIGGQARNYVAALDVASGAVDAWNPSASNNVYALAVSGGTVFAGGDFTSSGGQLRTDIAALDAASGAVTPWNPIADGEVRALLASGGKVYAGGCFSSIGGKARDRVAALDPITGAATAWNPGALGCVCALAASGSTIVVGGGNIDAVDTLSGTKVWSATGNGGVLALAVSGNTVYVGGEFTRIGTQLRQNIAALDAVSGAVTPWTPGAPDQYVYTLAVGGGTVYAGGNFSFISGLTRVGIAAFDAASGAVTAWNPNSDGGVNALAVSGTTVYVGGGFTSIGGRSRNRVAGLNVGTGAATAWNPNASGHVYALAVNGGTVYAGGNFTSIGGQYRPHLAAILPVDPGPPPPPPPPPPPGTIAWEPIVMPGDPGVCAEMAAVYHPGRHAMIVYGGANPAKLGDTWSLSLVPGGGWSLISPGGPIPDKRATHSMILNPLDDQLVIFGGLSNLYLNDTQMMSLSGQPSWFPTPAHGTPPSARGGHVAVYDPVRQRMLVIGGFGDAGYLNDVWEYSPPGIGTWRELTPLGDPMPGRTQGAAVYDPARDRVLVIGGDGGSFLNDVWALDLSGEPAWEQLHPSGNAPSPRREHTAIYDPVGDRIIVYGGFEHGPDYPYALWLGDIWALNLSGSPSWSRLFSSTPGPANRSGHVAIYDPVARRMVVFGGQTGTSQYSSEAWSLYLGDTPTPVAVSLASTEVSSDLVRFTWMAEGAVNLRAVVQRSDVGSSEWADLGNPTASGNGQLIFEDRTVQPGASYGYRLAIWEGGAPTILGPEWVTVPVLAVLSLTGVSPNPSERGVAVRFSLPSDERATLELFDLRGRRVAAREVGTLGAGNHFVAITEGQSLPAGVYLVRLTQGHRTLTAKACVVK